MSTTVDVHEILREAEAQREARAEQFPDEQVVIRMMIQCRLRLEELGWRSAIYAPKNGTSFTAINPGYTGPSECMWLGSGFFVADGGDWWPAQPSHFKLKPSADKQPCGECHLQAGETCDICGATYE